MKRWQQKSKVTILGLLAGLTLTSQAIAMAPPQGGSSEGGSMIMSLLPIFLIFGVFYFLILRPQKKQMDKHKQFLASIEKGAEVITTGGIYGTVTGVAENVVTLEIADKVKIKVLKSHVSGLATTAAPTQGSNVTPLSAGK